MAAISRKQRGRGRPFKPGQSGNPSGRPKDVGHIRELAKQYTEAAIRTLVGALKDKSRRTAVAAAEVLLDRGWGKATQHIEANVSVLDRLSHDDKRAVLEALDALAGGEGSAAGGTATRH